VEKDDPEVLGDEADDEFAVYRNGTKVCKGSIYLLGSASFAVSCMNDIDMM
jgi:hypothetical protein